MKIDCSKTVNFVKAKIRICKAFNERCWGCPLSSAENGENKKCSTFISENTEQAIEIVQKWSDEHSIKTRLELFYENYPNAPQHDGVPNACVGDFGYEGYAERHTGECEFCQECYMCRKCWNMPV